jgi:HEAT repeat protein
MVAALAVALWVSPAMAWADGGSVRYSYEQVEVGGIKDWVLVPRPALKLSGKITKSKVISAFNLLKKEKGTTYGKAAIVVKGKVPGSGSVRVDIDPKYSQYALIVIAETVYTLAEMGVDGVEFPGYSDGVVRPRDVPFDVYTLTVPMFKALAAGERTDVGEVMLSDGSKIPATEFWSRWDKKDAALQKSLFGYLESAQPYTIISTLHILPNLRVDYIEATAPLLGHSMASVRSKALETLASERKDARALKAVAGRLEKERASGSEWARSLADWLGASDDASFAVLDPLYTLEKGDEAKAAKALGALEKYAKDARAVAAIDGALRDKRAKVAGGAADSLGRLGKDDLLIAALGDDKVAAPIRMKVARALAGSKGKENKLAGLEYIANNAEERESIRAITTLGEQGDEGRTRVEKQLTSAASYRRQAAASLLAIKKDPAALPALARAAREAKGADAEEIEEAGYAVMVSQPLKYVTEQTKAKDAVIQRLAYRALGERALKENAGDKAFATLKGGVESKDPMVRGAAARAMGAYANAQAAEQLAKLAKDRSADVRRDVAVALASFKNGELVDTLVTYLDDKDPGVQAAAIRALGLRGEALAWDKIEKLKSSKNGEVRGAVMMGLSRLVDRKDTVGTREVLGILSSALSDKEAVVRVEAIRALGTFKSEEAVLSIAAQLNADEEEVRIAAVESLASTDLVSAVELVQGVLDDPSIKVRRAAIVALGALKKGNAKAALRARVESEKDEELQSLINTTLKKM